MALLRRRISSTCRRICQLRFGQRARSKRLHYREVTSFWVEMDAEDRRQLAGGTYSDRSTGTYSTVSQGGTDTSFVGNSRPNLISGAQQTLSNPTPSSGSIPQPIRMSQREHS